MNTNKTSCQTTVNFIDYKLSDGASGNTARPTTVGDKSIGESFIIGGVMDHRLSKEAHGEYMLDCMRQINTRLNNQLNEQIEFTRYAKYLERRNALLKRIISWLCWVGIVTFIIIGCARSAKAEEQKLVASYYSRASLIKEGTAKYNPKFIMANGKVFYDESNVCACNSFPLGAILCVTNSHGKSVVVVNSDRTNKRFTGKRIDLAVSQFAEIADINQGIESVVVERII